MKKGLSYIDVAVSAGIFLLGLTIAFVLMQQGIKMEDHGSLLLPAIKDNFQNYTYYTLYRTPLFIKSNINSEMLYVVKFPFNIPSNNLKFTDYNLNNINLIYDNNENPPLIGFNRIINSIDYEIYYIIYSEYFNTGLTTSNLDYPNSLGYNYKIGLNEQIYGMNANRFVNLPNYDAFKSIIKVPDSNDFSIIIYDSERRNVLYQYEFIKPSEEKSVYVLEYSSYLLYENSTRRPIIVNIKVW